jgi:XrtJ-associated TM-motif-TM protein
VLSIGDFCALTFDFSDSTFPIEDTPMKKPSLLLLGIACLFAVALPLHAQGGLTGTSDGPCDDSPENPTAILAVVGSAGAFLAAGRARYKARRDSSK